MFTCNQLIGMKIATFMARFEAFDNGIRPVVNPTTMKIIFFANTSYKNPKLVGEETFIPNDRLTRVRGFVNDHRYLFMEA